MGHWRITVEGHGIHHNSRPDDANEIAKKFVQDLRAAGHDHVKGEFQCVSEQKDEL
jgi:hypothetical protein